MGRAILAVGSDLHSGSVFSLCPPVNRLSDAREHRPSVIQAALNDLWPQMWGRVFEIADGSPVIGALNGDLVEGSRHPHECWTSLLKEQADAVISMMTPWHSKLSMIAVTRGTPYHVMEGAGVEDIIAKELGARPPVAHKRLRLEVEGVRFQFVHKGVKFGSREWTWENTLRLHVKSSMMRHLMAGQAPPDVFVYSHYHRLTDTGTVVIDTIDGNSHEARGFITPSWKLIDEWTNHTESPIADIGLLVFEIVDGTYKVHKLVTRFDPGEDLVWGR